MPPTSKPILSVIMPSWNAGPALATAMGSILAQTFTDFELIVLDDGSTDDSIRAARSLSDGRVRVISDGVRRGLASRLNQGVCEARGVYVERMDADDVSFSERFARQIDFLERHPEVDLLGCRALVFRGAGDIVGLLPFAPDHAALCRKPWSNIPLPHPTWMGRRGWFLANPYRTPEVLRAEDQELLLRASTTSRYACLPDILLGYRQGPFSLRRTWLARRSLLAAQLRLFSARGQWGAAGAALGITAAKVGVDLMAALPGASGLFFARMGGAVPAESRDSLAQCLAQV